MHAASIRRNNLNPNFDYLAEATGNYTTRIRVLRFAFGVQCRKEKHPKFKYIKEFSNEFEQNCEHEDAYLLFDNVSKYRYIRIKLGGHSNQIAQNIVINLENIESIVDVQGDRWHIMLKLRNAPSFDTEPNFPPLRQDGTVDKRRFRTRYPCLCVPPTYSEPRLEHMRVAPFTSKILFLQFLPADFDDFKSQAESFSLPIMSKDIIDIDSHGYYSMTRIKILRQWIATLPFVVAYQCDALLYNGLLNPIELLALKPRVNMLLELGQQYLSEVLRHYIVVLKQSMDNPTLTSEKLFDESVSQYSLANPSAQRIQSIHEHKCAHVTFTPTSMLLDGPDPDVSNRVLRWYPDRQDNFVRITLADEDKLPFRFAFEVDNSKQIYKNVVFGLLNEGLTLGGREFKFLGYSMSSYRTQTFWFMHQWPEGPQIADIIERIGDFSAVRNYPALYLARVAQAFTATEISIDIRQDEIFDEEDIEANYINDEGEDSTFCYTDGVGRISASLADEVWEALQRHCRTQKHTVTPSAYQVRLEGYKGVLVVDYTLAGRQIYFTASMRKFTPHDWKLDPARKWPLEIARSCEHPSGMHLNRPLIMLLEHHGVRPNDLVDLQRKAVKEARICLNSGLELAKVARIYGLGRSFAITPLLTHLHHRAILDLEDLQIQKTKLSQFVHRLSQLTFGHIMREFKHHARIPVPQAWSLVGVADRWDLLQEDEVYACIQEQNSHPKWIEGNVLLSRSPTVHPGDAQYRRAIGKPPQDSVFYEYPLPNVLVFSTKGTRDCVRDLPSQLGGGDLDGDIYNIITTEILHMPVTHEAGQYKVIEKKKLDKPADSADIAKNIIEYIDSDVVGLVATNHLLIADKSDFGLDDPDCLKLSELHSQAVDYPKSGTCVEMDEIPKPKHSEKPDWNAGELREPVAPLFYESPKAIGLLFRDIPELPKIPEIPQGAPIPAFQRILEAALENVPPPPIPQWPANQTPEQRLAPSQYPPLPADPPKHNGPKFIPQKKDRKIPATTIKIVRPRPSDQTLYGAGSNNGHNPTLNLSKLNAVSPVPDIPPGLGFGNPPDVPTASTTRVFIPDLPPGLGLTPQAAPGFLSPAGSSGASSLDELDPAMSGVDSITRRLRTLALALGVDIDTTSREIKHSIQQAYGRFVIELQSISVTQALGENLTEEELFVGTIMAKAQQSRRRRDLMERMRFLSGGLVRDLRKKLNGTDEQRTLRLDEVLCRAYAGYFVAAVDAEENIWGAASMCLVSLGVFSETISLLEGESDTPIEAMDEQTAIHDGDDGLIL